MTFELKSCLTLDDLLAVASGCSREIQIASAYTKSEPFRRICEVSTGCNRKILIVRWQFCDLVSGSSDLDIYKLAQQSGWCLYFHHDLHAKCFLLDNTFFIGSFNLTNRGLAGGPPSGNIEYGVKFSSSPDVSNWFDSLISRAVKVDESLYQAIKADIESYKMTSGNILPIRKGFSQVVNTLVNSRKAGPTLFLHDLPQSKSPENLINELSDPDAARHDLQLFGLPKKPTRDQLRNSFKISPGFTWLLNALGDEEAYFGTITAKLHNNLRDEPKPYRSEVKERLACLLEWSSVLMPDQVAVDRPRYSQKIRRVDY